MIFTLNTKKKNFYFVYINLYKGKPAHRYEIGMGHPSPIYPFLSQIEQDVGVAKRVKHVRDFVLATTNKAYLQLDQGINEPPSQNLLRMHKASIKLSIRKSWTSQRSIITCYDVNFWLQHLYTIHKEGAKKAARQKKTREDKSLSNLRINVKVSFVCL